MPTEFHGLTCVEAAKLAKKCYIYRRDSWRTSHISSFRPFLSVSTWSFALESRDPVISFSPNS